MKFTSMNRQNARLLHSEFDAMVKTFAAERGLKVAPSRCSFSDTGAKLSASFELLETADGVSGAKVEWDRWAVLYGLKPEWFGQPFSAGGNVYTISGLRTSARTRPILATRGDQTFLFKADDVRKRMTVNL